MDKLKNFIEKNRQAFDQEIPLPDGHLDRFDRKLPARKPRQVVWYSLSALVVAASVALLLFLNLPAYMQLAGPEETADKELCSISKEIKQLRYYYTMQMHDILLQMEELYAKEQVPGAADFLRETQAIVNGNISFEQNILPNLPCSDKGIYVMTQYYGTSVNSLQRMLEQMEEIIQENN